LSPALDQLGGPTDVQQREYEEDNVVRGSEGTCSGGPDIAVFNPQQDLHDEADNEHDPDIFCREFYELEVQRYLLSTVVLDRLDRDVLVSAWLQNLKLQLSRVYRTFYSTDSRVKSDAHRLPSNWIMMSATRMSSSSTGLGGGSTPWSTNTFR